ncbi:hypothetical protein FDP41_006603 [Naegleria fowleri]|uniref:LamG-like jellyroll fold domain-containing protein n=1 Tax=Naegleria fowleri TaxID=5763 RepID=A0A6A5BJI0_NAEFO|nr:uncharacterized protein FDP41_006603 [Naegleria fowleri]KAF0974571.1 hypothetical protein FDP41_006603 [Naegleria fowleri]CAG4715981.1 unnamed protein product [Naegleria fowleri]
MLEKLSGEVIGLILSFVGSLYEFKNLSLLNREFYHQHFEDENSVVILELLLFILGKEIPVMRQHDHFKSVWKELEAFKEYVKEHDVIKRKRQIQELEHETTYLDCLKVIAYENCNWINHLDNKSLPEVLTFQYDAHEKERAITMRFEGTNIHEQFLENMGLTCEMWVSFAQHSFFPVLCTISDVNWTNGFGLFEYTNHSSTTPDTINWFIRDWYREDKYFVTSPIPSTHQWVHYAGTFDLTTCVASLYVNGKLESQKTITDHQLQLHPGMQMVVGYSDYCNDINYHIRGEYTDIRLWNVCRTQDQIKETMNRRIFKYNLERKKSLENLIFNYYPDKILDTPTRIKNKTPNTKYKDYDAERGKSVVVRSTLCRKH